MFYGCSSLQSVDLSKVQVTALGEYAFSGCSSLTSVSLPNGFTTISQSMFRGCSSLPAIDLPGTVTTIGQYAFYGCSQLQGIAIPAGVTSMGNEAFRNCTSLTTAIVAGNIGTLPEYTFAGCSSLQTVSLAGSITTIGSRAFDGCSQLRDITLPSGLTTINEYAFYNCSALSVISLPSSLTTLGTAVFWGCSGLISLEVPEGVSSLPQSMFYNCSGMQSLYLPSTITEINSSSLDGLTNLIDMHILATTPPPLSYFSRASQVTLFVPEASIAAYQVADTWKNFKNIYAELTNLATLDDDEFALLQTIFQKTNGTEWTRPWVFGATKAETAVPYGVKVSDGHVKQIALVNNNLRTHLPQELMQFPQCWYINVSQNRFVNDIGMFFDNMTTPNTALTYLDLSDNLFSGNIGRIGNADSELQSTEKLPNLTTLKIARNQIRDVKPVLPAHITNLDLRGQEIDVDRTYFYSNFMDGSLESLPNLFPSILFYRHSNYRDYGNIHYLLWAPDAEEPWAVALYKYTTPSTSSYGYSGSGWNFLSKMSEIRLSTTESNVAERKYVRLLFDFQTGDVNYNDDIDVSDLQTLINYAIQPETFQHYSPFNWVAANIIAADGTDPEVINVQDVVAEVNLLLEQDIEPSLARKRKTYGSNETYGTNESCDATLSIESGKLVLESEVPVAALDLKVSGSVQWGSDMSLFTRKSRGGRTIFYSMMGDVLPAGRTVLGTVGTDASITAVSLADAEGQLIAVAIGSGETTGIGAPSLTLPEGKETQVVYDLQGRRIDGARLNKGVYIMNGKKQVVK